MGDDVDDGLWIFGYGSLVWRPAFPHVEKRAAVLRGFERRFFQGSPDHRGVPEAPGRVVTLVERAGARCAGLVYRVSSDEQDLVLSRLDVREQGGYERREVALETEAGGIERALVYWAGPDNPSWLGDAPLADMAAHVCRSKGPSGHNIEYVVELCRALEEMGEHDAHCFALRDAVQAECGGG